tara:strand:+ start:10508 stop:11110 length:603 start_codon:yes stop_codon:yes gene_type:complete
MKVIKVIAEDIIFNAINDYLSSDYQCVREANDGVSAIIVDTPFHSKIRDLHKKHPKASIILLVNHTRGQIDIPSFVKVIEKPLKMSSLKEFIKNLVIVVVILGPFRIYPKTRQMVCIKTDEKIPLTEKEIEIILFLRNKAGEVVSKDDLLASIWQYHPDITTHTLETHIYRLRKKLESHDVKDFLMTKENGYTLKLLENQ